MRHWNLLLAALVCCSIANRAAENEPAEAPFLRVHDPSRVVHENDTYWVFSTGRGVSSLHSPDLVHWEHGPSVFNEAPAWVAEAVPENRRMYFWAPDVIRLTNGYFLYYSVSSFGKNKSAIALARTRSLDPANPNYGWKDEGIVIQSERTNNFNAIDPAVTLDETGRLWMVFGSFWSGIKLVELDRQTGRRIAADSPLHSLAWKEQIEAPFIDHHGEFYYLFVNWGHCCRGTNSTYNIRVGRSREITGPYLDREGADLRRAGGTLLLASQGSFIGPGHAGILREGDREWMSLHYYDGAHRGASTIAIRPLHWDEEGWPEVWPTD